MYGARGSLGCSSGAKECFQGTRECSLGARELSLGAREPLRFTRKNSIGSEKLFRGLFMFKKYLYI